MGNEELENDTPINEEEQQPNAEDESTEEGDELAKANEVANNQKIRAEKAEAENKKLKADAEAKTEKETPKNESKESKPDEPDYAKLAFLEGKGITNPDDQKIVQDTADKLKLPLTDVLGLKYIKEQLKDAKDQREAEDGMPDSSGKGGSGAKSSVDYWVNKKDKDGNFLSPPDHDLQIKVINARIDQKKKSSMFADDKY